MNAVVPVLCLWHAGSADIDLQGRLRIFVVRDCGQSERAGVEAARPQMRCPKFWQFPEIEPQ